MDWDGRFWLLQLRQQQHDMRAVVGVHSLVADVVVGQLSGGDVEQHYDCP